ncbi:hypothetical protein CPB86DRAFT_791220 [Serendipita vermifera]|nr:hypothetical protein CPB86DRAFT_791220 [Serendipita vermifera]
MSKYSCTLLSSPARGIYLQSPDVSYLILTFPQAIIFSEYIDGDLSKLLHAFDESLVQALDLVTL